MLTSEQSLLICKRCKYGLGNKKRAQMRGSMQVAERKMPDHYLCDLRGTDGTPPIV